MLAALFGLALLTFPGLGVVDLVAAVLGGELAVLRAGYGLLVGFLLPVALLAVALRPDSAQAPVIQVLAAAAAFLLAAAAGALPTAAVGSVALLLMAVVLCWLLPVAPAGPRRRLPMARSVLVLAVLAAVPTVVYGGYLSRQQRRQAVPYEDFTLGLQGWSALVAFTATLVLSAAMVALRPAGWRFIAFTTAAAAIVFGCLVIMRPVLPGSPGWVGGAFAVGWGVALLLATARHRDSLRRL